jgi:hypothetical protein
MNIDFSTKPQITINLDPVLEAYCRLIFKTPVNQKEIIINRKLREGQAIYSKVYPIEFPDHKPFRKYPVTFILPLTKNNQGVLKYRFYHVSRMGEEQIHDDLEVLMQKWLFKFYKVGYRKKYSQDEITTAILRGMNLRKNAANFDAIKKFDYRCRRKTEEDLYMELLTA